VRTFLALIVIVLMGLPSGFALAQQEGILEVNSNVDGAVVYIDDVLQGFVPLVAVVSAGYHQVRVSHPSFLPMDRQILVAADTSVSVVATLERVRAGLAVRVDLPGARVFLDGEQVGMGDVVVDPVTAGLHQLSVETDEFGRYESSIFVAERTLTPVQVNILDSQGSLEVRSDPEGARVILDGDAVGDTPITVAPLRPGSHSLKLVSEGHATVFRDITVTPGDQARVDVTLVAAGGGLDIRTRPSEARVAVNGVVLGLGNQGVANLAPGSYSIRVTAPGHLDSLHSALVVAGKTTRVKARLQSFDGGSFGAGSPVGADRSALPIHKRPAFWVGVGAGGAAVLVAIIAGVAQSSASDDPGPAPPPGTAPPPATYTFALP
jgi:hypothetical protein